MAVDGRYTWAVGNFSFIAKTELQPISIPILDACIEKMDIGGFRQSPHDADSTRRVYPAQITKRHKDTFWWSMEMQEHVDKDLLH
ncbi:MAG: hypothetical protein Q9179_007382 [Wetmoreana sp. 5 TL-2023]